MNEGKKLHNPLKKNENENSFILNIPIGRKLLGDRYKDLNDEEIENILNVTINFSNCIINSYLDTIGKTQ